MADFTSDRLILDTRRRGMFPNATGLGSNNTDILAYLNDALQMYISPFLLSVSGEYLVAVEEATLSVNQEFIPIPDTALGNKVRDVQIRCTDRFLSMQQTEPERMYDFPATGDPLAYYFEDNKIMFVPRPQAPVYIRVKYYKRPNELVLSGSVGVAKINVVSVVDENYVLEVAAGTGSGVADSVVDVISHKSSFSNRLTAKPAESFFPDVITLSRSDFVSAPEIGDYITLSGTSPFAQIPQELYPLLAQRAAFEILEALKDPRSTDVLKKCEIMKNQILPLVTPRSEGTGRVVINPNAVGNRMQSRYRFWGWRS